MQGLTKYGNGYTEQEVLSELQFRRGSRRLRFRYDLLDSSNVWKGALGSVLSGSVSLNNLADIKRTAKFRVTDDGSINFLSDRIKPWVRLDMPVSTEDYTAVLSRIANPLARYRLDEPSTPTTLNANPGVEHGITGWTTVTNGTVGISDGIFFAGRGAGLITPNASVTQAFVESDPFPVIAGRTYRFQGECYADVGSGNCGINLEWLNNLGIIISTSSNTSAAASATWVFRNTTAVAPAGAVSARVVPIIIAGTTIGPTNKFRFDEVRVWEEPGVVTDSSGNGRNASLPASGVTRGFPGLLDGGSSMDFAPGNAGITASPAGWIDGNDSLTLVAWIQSDAVGVTQSILNGSSISLSYQTTGLVGGAASVIQAQFNTDHGNAIACTVAGMQTKAIQCIVVSWTAGLGIRIFVNGEPVALSGSTAPLAAAKTSSAFGAFVIGNGFDGRIDDVSVFHSPITDDQAREIYQAGAKVGRYGAQNYVEWPQGVFLLSSPSRQRTDTGVVYRDVDAYDQLQVLTDDKVADRYTVAAGAFYTEAVRDLMSTIPTKSIANSSITLPVAKDWDPGTSKLTIINDLLSAINYRSLSFDEDGTGIVQPYTSPQDRPAEYEFADGETSVISPDMTQELDVFSVPNKWVLVVSDPDRTALTSTYTNADPTSITSTTSRGRTIVDFRTEQDAADQTSLDGLAKRLAFEASQVFEEITFTTAIFPIMGNDDVYDLTYSGLAISDKYSAHTWDLTLEAGSMMKHTARRVVQV